MAKCLSLPDCIAQGKTRGDAQADIKEAVEGYLESLKKHDEPIPPPITQF
uniref:Type II toxin-antitoxin system HicB family antitoxin n=1 Tax=Desulfobacca acetoxidans TaxID=60893 RepID=A0A7V6DQS4_9BACT